LRVLIPRLEPDRVGSCEPRPVGNGAGTAGGGVCMEGSGGRDGIFVEGGRVREDVEGGWSDALSDERLAGCFDVSVGINRWVGVTDRGPCWATDEFGLLVRDIDREFVDANRGIWDADKLFDEPDCALSVDVETPGRKEDGGGLQAPLSF
jgi:hypothetical protein